MFMQVLKIRTNFKDIIFFNFVELFIVSFIFISSYFSGNLEKEDKEHREQYLFLISLSL